ncbi:hypothetical protein B0H34DRAFT_844726 [Crassisporium funariophilum]|nr:hypothetical protein B0H34DRAFT_844726 [Crassisporium funariophilum]
MSPGPTCERPIPRLITQAPKRPHPNPTFAQTGHENTTLPSSSSTTTAPHALNPTRSALIKHPEWKSHRSTSNRLPAPSARRARAASVPVQAALTCPFLGVGASAGARSSVSEGHGLGQVVQEFTEERVSSKIDVVGEVPTLSKVHDGTGGHAFSPASNSASDPEPGLALLPVLAPAPTVAPVLTPSPAPAKPPALAPVYPQTTARTSHAFFVLKPGGNGGMAGRKLLGAAQVGLVVSVGPGVGCAVALLVVAVQSTVDRSLSQSQCPIIPFINSITPSRALFHPLPPHHLPSPPNSHIPPPNPHPPAASLSTPPLTVSNTPELTLSFVAGKR